MKATNAIWTGTLIHSGIWTPLTMTASWTQSASNSAGISCNWNLQQHRNMIREWGWMSRAGSMGLTSVRDNPKPPKIMVKL